MTRLARGCGRHRSKSRAELRAELRVAYGTISGLLDQNTRLRDAHCELEAQLEQAGTDYAGALEELQRSQTKIEQLRGRVRQAVQEATDLRLQLAPYLAAEANATSITVPPMCRDTSHPDDQATDPHGINVRPLWEALGVGAVVILDSLHAADPEHVLRPSWAREGPEPTPAA
ncbi:hypothetical protein [Streptomyces sp. CC224B]|uniref:hypothetical protein n=1 Tax=Streptomyces sp. CC224B TaxID=3044571 RepID=UPI0024A9E0CD|nr:hypothetical protein [Streptomyces sp. CC224B]